MVKVSKPLAPLKSRNKEYSWNVSYFIDGKKVNKEEVDKLDPSIIEKWMSLKTEKNQILNQ
jgi:hypothetical protein